MANVLMIQIKPNIRPTVSSQLYWASFSFISSGTVSCTFTSDRVLASSDFTLFLDYTETIFV